VTVIRYSNENIFSFIG